MSVPLGRQQVLGKILGLIPVLTAYFGARSVFTPAAMFVAVQICGSALSAGALLWLLRRNFPAELGTLKYPWPRLAQFLSINLLSGLQKAVENSAILTLGGLPMAGVYGVTQRLFSAVYTVFAAGTRNLWPYWARSMTARPERIRRSAARLRVFAFLVFGAAGVSSLVWRDRLMGSVAFNHQGYIALFVLAWVGFFSLASISISSNVLAALDSQGSSVLTCMVHCLSTAAIWLLLAKVPGSSPFLLTVPYFLATGISWAAELGVTRGREAGVEQQEQPLQV